MRQSRYVEKQRRREKERLHVRKYKVGRFNPKGQDHPSAGTFLVHLNRILVHLSPFLVHLSSFLIYLSPFLVYPSPFLVHLSLFLVYPSPFIVHLNYIVV